MTGADLVALILAAAVLAWPGRVPATARVLALARPRTNTAERAGARSVHRLLTRQRGRLRALGPGSASGRSLERERAVVALLEGLAAGLRAGLTPAQAFDHVARAAGAFDVAGPSAVAGAEQLVGAEPLGGLVSRLATQASAGAPLEPVLRLAAARLGSPALLATAAGWAMAERHGAPVVDVLDGLVAALRDAARSAAAVETALAAPRATATLLGVLPLGGVALGELVGVDPVAVLIGTPLGRVALVLGLTATWGGRVWMRRLVQGVGPQGVGLHGVGP